MAVGGPTSWLFEVQWDGATYVDESAYLKAGEVVSITRGRGSEADDIQIGVMEGVLDNARADLGSVGRFTPDNPLSALWPNVVDGARCRFTVTRGTSSVRHRGRLSVSTPELPEGKVENSEVEFGSVDALAIAAGKTLRSEQVERGLRAALLDEWDVFPMEPGAAPTVLPNLGNAGGTAELVRALTGVGSAALVADPEGIRIDGAIKLTAVDSVGPLVYIKTGVPVGGVNDVIFPFRTGDRVASGGADKYIAVGRDAAGNQAWSIRLNDNAGQTDISWFDGAGTLLSNLYFGYAPVGAAAGDDQWFAIWMFWNGASTTCFLVRTIDDVILRGPFSAAVDVRDTVDVVLGGLASRRSKRKNSACITGQFGPVVIGAAGGSVGTAYLSPDVQEAASTRVANLCAFADLTRTTFGTRDRQVAITGTTGRTVFDCLAEVCRSTGATIVASPTVDDSVRLLLPDQLRSATVALTLDAEQDLDGGDGITWSKGAGPSSVTATYPGGSVTYTDPDRQRRDESIEVAALSEAHAIEAASALVNTSRRLRIERLVIDLAGATNDLWSAVMALEIGARIRVTLGAATSLLARHYGRTYVDVYALGWTENYGRDVAYWVIDTIAADDPVVAKFDDTVRGRFAARPGTITVTGGTAVGVLGTGTIVATTDAGQPALTTAASAYPMTLDWSGEYVTVTTAPASSTSPQTLTITARGVDGTIARAHATGEPLNVAYPATHAF